MALGIEIIAHRGFSSIAPENTMAAFEAAWKAGADACELDLHLTADDQIVVIHDKDTRRTTGTKRVVADSTRADLQSLDAGSWKADAYAGEPIPTLTEALTTLPAGNQRFFLEIKCGPRVVPILARELESWKDRAAQLCIMAFDRTVAQEAKAALPWLKVYRLSSEKTRFKRPIRLDQLVADSLEDGLDGLSLSQNWRWDEAMVKQVRAANFELYVWTVNDPTLAQRIAKWNIDGIITDDPVKTADAVVD
jgi:glycerophosphoryl diester phosphodiesterase